ncbi:uncharacterized protein LOC128958231 [Oppia nitens]|uniref:uncharacterized protein LOC128958231 n=1 Tax=Oppia nitens TaxID=1686743 RepID=UPI0023DC1D36|nr:uncharacterized protein LOC128958231 [Oppia nitens]
MFIDKSQSTSICDIKSIKSVFNLNDNIYTVENSDTNQSPVFWKSLNGSNSVSKDNELQSLIEKCGFIITKPIFGIHFSRVYECHMNEVHCRDPNYTFDGIDHCKGNALYCQNMTKFIDVVLIIGYDSEAAVRQSYQAFRYQRSGDSNGNDLTIIDNINDMPFGWPVRCPLNDSKLFYLQTGEVVEAVNYNPLKYELIVLFKSAKKDKIMLRSAMLKIDHWFYKDRWTLYDPKPVYHTIGLVQMRANIYAIGADDNFQLFYYKIFGLQNHSREFTAQSINYYGLFKCTGSVTFTVNPDYTTITTTITTGAQPLPNSSSTSRFPNNQSMTTRITSTSSIPINNFWHLIIIPLFLIITVVVVLVISYICFYRTNKKVDSTTITKPVTPQNREIKTVLQR